jgi:hypothetical protein
MRRLTVICVAVPLTFAMLAILAMEAMAETAGPDPDSGAYCYVNERFCGTSLSLSLGSSFFPGGVGIGAAYEVSRIAVELGYGVQAKEGVLGHPLFGGVRVVVTQRLYLSLFASHYQGAGMRHVVFPGDDLDFATFEAHSSACSLLWGEGGVPCPDHAWHDAQVSWNLWYAHLGAGYTVWHGDSLRARFEVGLAYNVYSRLQVSDADRAALGRPERIYIEDKFNPRGSTVGAGAGDLGAYIALAMDAYVAPGSGGL